MKEQWRKIPNEEGYLVSDLGRVKSLNYRRTGREQVLKQSVNGKYGYCYVNIRGKLYAVHSLVATAFVTNPNGYPDVKHIDGNTLHNEATNLEWALHSFWNRKDLR